MSVRFLHTADWHVGKSLRGRSRTEEHRAVLAEIAEIAKENRVDVVLIAGDLFETAAPSPEAEEVVYAGLYDLSRIASHVVLIAGNHDNPRRLEAIQPFLKLTNIHAAPTLARPEEGGVLRLETKTEPVQIVLYPFLSQRGIVRADDLMESEGSDHAAAYAERAVRVIGALCANLPRASVNILLGHAMVYGGMLGGGERSAHTIFEYSVPTTAFPGSLHYVALGHLHRAQELRGACPIWFSGSPLQLDFGETEDVKSVNVIDALPGKPADVEKHPLRAGRRLRSLQGTLEQLEALAQDVGDEYLRVTVDSTPSPGLADQVRAILPNAVDVQIPPRKDPHTEEQVLQRIGRSPRELFGEYLTDRDEDDERVRALFDTLLEEVYASDPAGA